MTNAMGKIMAEVLSLLAIATKEMKQGRTSEHISYASIFFHLISNRKVL
jgi:hypothetical protein